MRDIELFTVGHSNHSLEHLIGLLERHEIHTLVDIRRFPSSRAFPHFNQLHLASALQVHGIEYQWLESLGGRRPKGSEDSPGLNLGLRNQSFRNYADYMLTEEFRGGIEGLRAIASASPAAIMCSESVFWRCHRRLVSDYVLANGGSVWHIFPDGEARTHVLTEGARLENGNVTYPGPKTLFD